MNLVFVLYLLGAVAGVLCEGGSDNEVSGKTAESSRQKRLLFYDEDGNLVKTYTNPYLRDFMLNPEKLPVFRDVLNPLLAFLRPPFGNPTHYMIPVSNDVIQQINADPSFQNKLVLLPAKDANVEANPLCSGRRNQIPSPATCNRFLNCWDGWAFEQECPAGLLFSNQGYCDYPHNVNCYDRRVKEVEQPQCNKDFEVYRNQMQCSEFFVCVNQQPVKFKCPADLAYNQDLGICDYPQRVNCNAFGTASSLSSTSQPLTSSPIPEAPSTQIASSSETQPEATKVVEPTKPPILVQSPPIQTIFTKSNYNKESWSSTQVAVSRQDAIRQLEIGRLAKVNTSY